jgi:hypothetical protein
VRQVFADELNAIVENLLGRKVLTTLSDHNARANTTCLLFVLEPAEPGRLRSVPLAAGEPSESDEADQDDDQPDPEAPHEHQHDPGDHDDAAE